MLPPIMLSVYLFVCWLSGIAIGAVGIGGAIHGAIRCAIRRAIGGAERGSEQRLVDVGRSSACDCGT